MLCVLSPLARPLALACRTGCCRTTLVAGTSCSGLGLLFRRPSPSGPRFCVPFCPVDGRTPRRPGGTPYRSAAPPDPLLVRPELAPCRPWAGPTCRRTGRRRSPAGRPGLAPPAAVPVFAPGARRSSPSRLVRRRLAALAAPAAAEPDAGAASSGWPAPGRPWSRRPARPPRLSGLGVQFRNMTYCWPSVHRLVVTQYSTRPYCQYKPGQREERDDVHHVLLGLGHRVVRVHVGLHETTLASSAGRS